MLDSHAHLYLCKNPLDKLIANAKTAGITHIINIGINLETSQQALKQHEQYPNIIFPTIGIHPAETQDLTHLDTIETLAKTQPFVAIGEAGLDYYKLYTDKTTQQQCFDAQLDLAERLNLPIIIHNRDADDDIKAMIKRYPKVTKILHCFSSSLDFATSVLDNNTFISFAGQATYAKKGKTVTAIKALPLEKLLIETDSPYITPKAHKGSPNEPAFVIEIAKKIAHLKNIPTETVINATRQLGQTLFKLSL